MQVGSKVRKNPKTWLPSSFDEWGAGEGIGEIVSLMYLDIDIVDVRWPAGRATQLVTELILIDDELR